MRKTILIVILIITLLAAMIGYIAGTSPIKSSGSQNSSDQNPASTISAPEKSVEDRKGDQSSDNQNSATGNQATPSPAALPKYEQLLVTATTDPLPLSLQAGTYFSNNAAKIRVSALKKMNYQASLNAYAYSPETTIYVVILGVFKTEAELQLAKYKLFKESKIVTQRINTPPPPKP